MAAFKVMLLGLRHADRQAHRQDTPYVLEGVQEAGAPRRRVADAEDLAETAAEALILHSSLWHPRGYPHRKRGSPNRRTRIRTNLSWQKRNQN
jgi:hypothetical protein